jgi:hypothetical protein
VLCRGPKAEVSEEPCEVDGLVVGVEAAGVGEDPGVAATEEVLLKADAGVFNAGDDAVRTDANKSDNGGSPTSDFGFEAPAAGAKFFGGEFIGAGGGTFDDVRDAEFEVEKEGILERGEEARGEAALVKGSPEAIAGAAEMAADRGRVEAGVDAGKEYHEVFGDEIRDELVVRREELGLRGFPGSRQFPIHHSVSASLFSRNESGNAGIGNGIKPDPRRNFIDNPPRGDLRKGENSLIRLKVFDVVRRAIPHWKFAGMKSSPTSNRHFGSSAMGRCIV